CLCPMKPEIQVLQYVDDLLISGQSEGEVRQTTLDLLNFLGRKGLRVSKKKLQFVEPEVKYLGHIISGGGRRLDPERVRGIVSLELPRTKREIRQFL
ncbi:TF29 protein, partial [Neodrepanis coruscans]|nr:TF29 protein [Neodrepanis coruscans]